MKENKIEAKELRVNNLVYFNGRHKEIGYISQIITYFHSAERVGINARQDITYCIDEIEPIPLTEEWLLSFRFESFGKLNPTYKLNPFIVELSVLRDHYNFRKIMNKEESINLKEIKYVHQLQNLFFALKGKELTTRELTSKEQ